MGICSIAVVVTKQLLIQFEAPSRETDAASSQHNGCVLSTLLLLLTSWHLLQTQYTYMMSKACPNMPNGMNGSVRIFTCCVGHTTLVVCSWCVHVYTHSLLSPLEGQTEIIFLYTQIMFKMCKSTCSP